MDEEAKMNLYVVEREGGLQQAKMSDVLSVTARIEWMWSMHCWRKEKKKELFGKTIFQKKKDTFTPKS